MGTYGNLRELSGTDGNLWELMGTLCVARACISARLMRCGVLRYISALQSVFTLRFYILLRVLHCAFALRDVFTLRFCVARCFYTTFLRCKAFFSVAFLRCKAFFAYVFALQGIFTLRFCEASRFYTTFS